MTSLPPRLGLNTGHRRGKSETEQLMISAAPIPRSVRIDTYPDCPDPLLRQMAPVRREIRMSRRRVPGGSAIPPLNPHQFDANLPKRPPRARTADPESFPARRTIEFLLWSAVCPVSRCFTRRNPPLLWRIDTPAEIPNFYLPFHTQQ
jgi:hypothetical protein